VRAGAAHIAHALFLLSTFLFPMLSPCQELNPLPVATLPEKPPLFTDMTIWSGNTVGSVNVMSTYPGQEMFAMGVVMRQHIHTFRHTEMQWNFEAIPFCIPSFPTTNGRTYHYGGGGSLGIDLSPQKQWKVQPFVDTNVGLLEFTNDTPVNTRRFNFSLQFGPGFIVLVRGRSSLKLGIRFFHFSNAHTVMRNPGFDGLFIYAGYAFNLGRRPAGAS
jgi:hypothetical protein